MSSYFAAHFFNEIGFATKLNFNEFSKKEIELSNTLEKIMVDGITEIKMKCKAVVLPVMDKIKQIEQDRKTEMRNMKEKAEEKRLLDLVTKRAEEMNKASEKKRKVIDLSDVSDDEPTLNESVSSQPVRQFKSVPFMPKTEKSRDLERIDELEKDLEIGHRGYDRLKREYQELQFERDAFKESLKNVEEDFFNLKSECEIMQSDNQSWSENFNVVVKELEALKLEKGGLLKKVGDLEKELKTVKGWLSMFMNVAEKVKSKK